jgi:hypothetical protein
VDPPLQAPRRRSGLQSSLQTVDAYGRLPKQIRRRELQGSIAPQSKIAPPGIWMKKPDAPQAGVRRSLPRCRLGLRS